MHTACAFDFTCQNILPPSTTSQPWTQSKMYKSFALQEWDKFQHILRCKSGKGSLMQTSPFIPANFEEYTEHRLGILEEAIAALRSCIASRQREFPSTRTIAAFGGKDASGMISRLEDYLLCCEIGQPPKQLVKTANRDMDECLAFRSMAEFWVGEDLLKRL